MCSMTAVKERCFNLIERFPEGQLPTLVVSIEAMLQMVDEAADDAFCLALAERHDRREDKDEPGIAIEDFAAQLGITLGYDDES